MIIKVNILLVLIIAVSFMSIGFIFGYADGREKMMEQLCVKEIDIGCDEYTNPDTNDTSLSKKEFTVVNCSAVFNCSGWGEGVGELNNSFLNSTGYKYIYLVVPMDEAKEEDVECYMDIEINKSDNHCEWLCILPS